MSERETGMDTGPLGVGGFTHALEQIVVAPAEIRTTSHFTAWLRGAGHNGVLLGRMRASEHHSKNRAVAGNLNAGCFVFNYQVSGRSRVAQDDRVAELGPGDFVVFTADRPYEMHFDSEGERVGVVVPRARFRHLASAIDGLTARRIGAEDMVAKAMGGVLQGLEDSMSQIPASMQPRFVEHTVDTLETLARHAATLQGEQRTNANLGRLDAALAYIDAHLEQPDLAPSVIAQQTFMSLRALYALFEAADMSVAATIRSRRLEQCRRELIDPVSTGRSLGGIAARWGFSSPSHFSELFRSTYGVTPSEYRRRQASIAEPA